MNDEYQPIRAAVVNKWNKEEKVIEFGESLNMEAHLAFLLISKWGMVAASPDGEDSAGRAKIRPSTPDELVTLAIDTSHAFYERVRALGWTVAVPLPLAAVTAEKASNA